MFQPISTSSSFWKYAILMFLQGIKKSGDFTLYFGGHDFEWDDFRATWLWTSSSPKVMLSKIMSPKTFSHVNRYHVAWNFLSCHQSHAAWNFLSLSLMSCCLKLFFMSPMSCCLKLFIISSNLLWHAKTWKGNLWEYAEGSYQSNNPFVVLNYLTKPSIVKFLCKYYLIQTFRETFLTKQNLFQYDLKAYYKSIK